MEENSVTLPKNARPLANIGIFELRQWGKSALICSPFGNKKLIIGAARLFVSLKAGGEPPRKK
ncbi:MAG: hypothetical protein A2508_04985 [Candidatus Lambdaproteobacteria bacterium RIFOXYD12_FULL_49_8]|uniref:Uncharacterized protein n=1 Tax=Candidatus Lambdaproteobacteria bacterium RIFOXYD2_FULL_50_16 TaxID=1817772 RepID=A0A1F6G7L7_9PROT|nr:MAG: hypothetical protein A2527_09670 [Candidatus Lambdaproteobacteria bacterium RIFOXYD2_FULL_50_16]OGG96144.1 MAG: hypothetical protein A2508_04985 [Candidatus Lambdaproteobacteria bacterium RIFOXYD12_FULL_49_8]